jgi:Domain of unknown function (DUF4145)
VKIIVRHVSLQGTLHVSGRCPHCGKEAVLSPIEQHDFELGDGNICGQRMCPNPECKGHLFVVIRGGRIVESYPPIRLDFNAENVPERIKKAFEEAIACQASSLYIAAAIMVRRTLEELCADRQAQGKDLKERIADLRSKIVVPQELLDAMDELRILGNDAAHIEAKEYDNISEPEIAVAIPDGHFKFPHLWPGQIPPGRRQERMDCYAD